MKTMPVIRILLPDSTTIYNAGSVANRKPSLYLYFSPSCEHCQRLIQQLLEYSSSFKTSNVYLVTPFPFKELKWFVTVFRLNDYKNIIAGEDIDQSFQKIFGIADFPTAVVYDRQGRIVRIFQGEVGIDKIQEALNSSL